MNRMLFLAALLPALAFGQNLPDASPTAAPGGNIDTQATPGEGNQPNDTVVDQIERLLLKREISNVAAVEQIEMLRPEREISEASAAAQMPPDKPRTHRYTNQTIARVLRILA